MPPSRKSSTASLSPAKPTNPFMNMDNVITKIKNCRTKTGDFNLPGRIQVLKDIASLYYGEPDYGNQKKKKPLATKKQKQVDESTTDNSLYTQLNDFATWDASSRVQYTNWMLEVQSKVQFRLRPGGWDVGVEMMKSTRRETATPVLCFLLKFLLDFDLLFDEMPHHERLTADKWDLVRNYLFGDTRRLAKKIQAYKFPTADNWRLIKRALFPQEELVEQVEEEKEEEAGEDGETNVRKFKLKSVVRLATMLGGLKKTESAEGGAEEKPEGAADNSEERPGSGSSAEKKDSSQQEENSSQLQSGQDASEASSRPGSQLRSTSSTDFGDLVPQYPSLEDFDPDMNKKQLTEVENALDLIAPSWNLPNVEDRVPLCVFNKKPVVVEKDENEEEDQGSDRKKTPSTASSGARGKRASPKKSFSRANTKFQLEQGSSADENGDKKDETGENNRPISTASTAQKSSSSSKPGSSAVAFEVEVIPEGKKQNPDVLNLLQEFEEREKKKRDEEIQKQKDLKHMSRSQTFGAAAMASDSQTEADRESVRESVASDAAGAPPLEKKHTLDDLTPEQAQAHMELIDSIEEAGLDPYSVTPHGAHTNVLEAVERFKERDYEFSMSAVGGELGFAIRVLLMERTDLLILHRMHLISMLQTFLTDKQELDELLGNIPKSAKREGDCNLNCFELDAQIDVLEDLIQKRDVPNYENLWADELLSYKTPEAMRESYELRLLKEFCFCAVLCRKSLEPGYGKGDYKRIVTFAQNWLRRERVRKKEESLSPGTRRTSKPKFK
ncbi:unnamed protein product [Amoebophrya sp. A120]|nr:unnamed protein product [Amoebophrya sp. A120]|eukprot:GSA120T00020222001.1